jgi:dTDP-4-amino-4,6-dideoxygalactose transaminase
MSIPLLDLVAQYHTIKDEMDQAVLGVLESGKFILGPNVTALEQEVAAYLGVKYAIGVASGTDALLIALRAAGVEPGDEVIVPAYSFFATAGMVLSAGAKPVFVDVDSETYLIDVGKIEAVITSKTKAIIPVHLYGQPADMDEILVLARKHKLKVVEDNAQAIGAEYKGKKTATLGDVGCLSFFPSKNLGGYGDGGMIVTDDEKIAEQSRMLRVHGWRKKYFPEMLGYNSRLDELQAAILRVKLKHLDDWNERRGVIAALYSQAFKKLDLSTPVTGPDRKHVYHLYVMSFQQRDRVQQTLKETGIASDVYYPQPLHLASPCRALGYKEGQFPVSEKASRNLLAIPLYPELSKIQIEEVMHAVQKATQTAG